MHHDETHIREWLAATPGAEVASEKLSQQFANHLNSIQWNIVGNHPEWLTRRFVDVDLNETSAVADFHRSAAARHATIFFLYSPDEPGLLCPTSEALDSLDVVYCTAPGPNYFCGADRSGDIAELAVHDFAEYDGGQRIRLVL